IGFILHAKSKNVSAQKKRFGPKGAVSTRQDPSQSSPTSEPKSFQASGNDRTNQDVVYQSWCIHYLQQEPAQSYELKSGLIHLLPKFHGFAGEDRNKYLKEFHVAFPFSMDGAAKDWLFQ
ncbi:hypothetical protein CR513_24589, partial [Mucuna pruriens]